MNKEQFLKELSIRLDILTEAEKDDILLEYGSVIDEKIKNGQSEAEAIGDFGDMDELVREIMKAYKINPDYDKNDNDDQESLRELLEVFVKKAANWLSDLTKKIVKSISKSDIDKPHVIFEIIVKSILFLIVITVLRFPFSILNYIGTDLLFPMFGPFEYIFTTIFRIMTFGAYFVLCIIIAIYFFKEYYSPDDASIQKSEKKKDKEYIKSKSKDSNDNSKKEKSKISFILKIFLLIIFLIPLHFVLVGLSVGMVVLLYLLYKSIDVWGLIIIFIGLIILFSYFIYIVRSIYKKYHPASILIFIISIALITLGSLVTYETYNSLVYHDEIHPEIKETEKRYETIITGDIVIENNINGKDNVILEVDSSLLDGEVIIVAQYFNDFYNLNFMEGRNIIRVSDKRGIRFHNEALDIIISDLSKKEIYNYSHFANFKLKIISNEKTQNQISIR